MAPKMGRVEGFNAVELKLLSEIQTMELCLQVLPQQEIGQDFLGTSGLSDEQTPLYLLKYVPSAL